MGDGTKENPFTRQDVLGKIAENGGTARGLDLSGRVFEEGIDLSGQVLCGIVLSDALLVRANFNGADLDGAVMQRANLEHATFNPLLKKETSLVKTDLRGAYLKFAEFQEADLSGAQLQKDPEKSICANLEGTDFRGANLSFSNLEECFLYRTKLQGAYLEGTSITEARLGDTIWGNYKIGEEVGEPEKRDYENAEHRYRQLKMKYANGGYYDVAAKFYYREKEANRKSIRFLSEHWNDRLAAEFMRALFGYGERWHRVSFWIAGLILVFAFVYYAVGMLTPNSFLHSLYFSAVSFTALGYGGWAPRPTGWAKALGVAETFIGVFMMALLLVTFVRKWTR